MHVGHSNGSLEVEAETAAWPFWVPQASEAKKGVTLLPGVAEPNYQGKLVCCYTLKERKNMSGMQEIPWSLNTPLSYN